MEDLKKTAGVQEKPLYQYAAAVLRLVPILGHYFTPEEARARALQQEQQIRRVMERRIGHDGRGG